MEMGLGYIIGYNPANATVDIRTTDGTSYNSLPFDSSIALYTTPVLPILRTDKATGAVTTVKIGSFVMFYKFNDSNIRIVRLFNDDQDMLRNFAGRNTRPIHGYIQDTLLAMLQDGETLLQAPGRIIETKPGVYERQQGAWLLLKNSGDMILSNANTSCELWMSNDGRWEATATKYRVQGTDSKIEEQDDGTLRIAAGDARGNPVEMYLGITGTVEMYSGTSSMIMSGADYSISAGAINLIGGNEINLSTTAFDLTAFSIVAAADSIDMSADTRASLSANELNLAAGATATIEAGTAVVVNAPKQNLVMNQDGTTLTLEADAKVTIIVGEAKLLMNKDGVTLIPPPGKAVGVGESASKQVLIEGTAAQNLVPVYSTILKVAS